jgi:NAD+ kinase
MNPVINKVGLLFKRHDPRAGNILADFIPWLESRGVEVILDQESARQYSQSCRTSLPENLPAHSDVIAVFGGDGTLLHAARLVAGSGIPILGVNLGSLGFLTEVKLEEFRLAFEDLLSGDYTLENRILLGVEVFRKDRVIDRYLAVNDAVINKGALARIIELEVTVNSQLVSLIRADGLIVATPTGSTAYSLSAGGPIIYPTMAAFIINPICPHTLTNRPVVVPDDGTIGVRLIRGSDVMLTVDGQVGMLLEQQDCLKVQKAGPVIRLVQVRGNTFFKVLREKLKWG